VIDSETGSPTVFLPRRRLHVQGCTLGDSPAWQDLQGTYRETSIEKFVSLVAMKKTVVSHFERAESRIFTFERFTRVDLWWLRRGPRPGASTGWSCLISDKLRVGPIEGVGIVASWKHFVRDPWSWRRALRAAASILLFHHRGWKMDWQSFSLFLPIRCRARLRIGPSPKGWRCISLNACTVGEWPAICWWTQGQVRLHCSCVLWLAVLKEADICFEVVGSVIHDLLLRYFHIHVECCASLLGLAYQDIRHHPQPSPL